MSLAITSTVKNFGKTMSVRMLIRNTVPRVSVTFPVSNHSTVTYRVEITILQGKCDYSNIIENLVLMFCLKKIHVILEQKDNKILFKLFDEEEINRVTLASRIIIGELEIGTQRVIYKDVAVQGIVTHPKGTPVHMMRCANTFNQLCKGFGTVKKSFLIQGSGQE